MSDENNDIAEAIHRLGWAVKEATSADKVGMGVFEAIAVALGYDHGTNESRLVQAIEAHTSETSEAMRYVGDCMLDIAAALKSHTAAFDVMADAFAKMAEARRQPPAKR